MAFFVALIVRIRCDTFMDYSHQKVIDLGVAAETANGATNAHIKVLEAAGRWHFVVTKTPSLTL